MRNFDYALATTEAEALELGNRPGAQYLGGGTNLVDLMREQIAQPDSLVDVSRLFTNIEIDHDRSVYAGASVRNTTLAAHPVVQERMPLLTQAIVSGASGQIRNSATVSGNLLQRTRCLYFYDSAARCNKRTAGAGCDAAEGFNRYSAVLGTSDSCVATHPSDFCVALSALGADVVVRSDRQRYEVPLEHLYHLPGDDPRNETVLEHGDLITGIRIAMPPVNARMRYWKIRDRASYAFALVSIAALVVVEDTRIADVRLAYGGLAPKPWRANAAEQVLRGVDVADLPVDEALDAEFATARPLRDNAFKLDLARRATRQLLTQLCNEATA